MINQETVREHQNQQITLPYLGLTSEQVRESRLKYGANVMTPPAREAWWKLFLEKFEDPVIRILMVAAFVAIAVGFVEGEFAEGIGILVAILLSTILAFINEHKANQEFDVLNQVYDEVMTKVIRDFSFTTVARKDLVVGDIAYLEQGEEVPADGSVLQEIALSVDQSKITGESEPVKKRTQLDVEIEEEEGAFPAYNLYRSTIVDQGQGYFKVTAVGDQTEIGQIANAIASVEIGEETPLNLQLESLSKLIGVIGLSFAALTFIALMVRGFITGELHLDSQQWYFVSLLVISVLVGLVQVWLPVMYDGLVMSGSKIEPPKWLEGNGLIDWAKNIAVGALIAGVGLGVGILLGWLPASSQTWLPTDVGKALLHNFMVAVTIIVVAVPEGLPMSVTLSLAYSMRKMAAAKNLVRRMHACETMGAATVICSDKTGTLTQNQMRVQTAGFACLESQKPEFFSLVAEAIAGNSTADLDRKPLEKPQVIGNATEGALLLWLDQQEINYMAARSNFKIQTRQPFSTQHKYMATVGISALDAKSTLYVKGAPEVVLARCSKQLGTAGQQPLNNSSEILLELKGYQSRGMRTLGFAYRTVNSDAEIEQLAQDMIWLGFVAILDPVRQDVPDAIRLCRNAGIQVKIVTGDNSDTAQEIARQIGLYDGPEQLSRYSHLTGQEFSRMGDHEAAEAVLDLKVLSRARPMDKLRLVKLLQQKGQIVSVTGDGTNDAAALKQAQVGLSMGSGTAIAKEASDIILLDDSFRSVVNAVLWGRSLYENIQRFILFQLTINVVALGIALLGPFIGVALPLTVTQMLWVNLIMDTFAALALATEPPHWKVMQQPPRKSHTFIVTRAMTQNIFVTGSLFLIILIGLLIQMRDNGGATPYQLSQFFAFFVMLQFWNLFNARCLGLNQSAFKGLKENPSFLAIAAIILAGQILIVQYAGGIFRTVPISFSDWLIVIFSTSTVLWIGEFIRFGKRLRSKN
jgi:P-type Ca2+ transporter type 2C